MLRVIRIHAFLLLSYICITFSAYAGIDDGLISYYSFDDSQNLGNDGSGNGHDGTLTGSPASNYTEDGISGGALVMTNANDGILVPSSPDFQVPTMSIAFWFKKDSLSNVGILFARDITGNSSSANQWSIAYNINVKNAFGFTSRVEHVPAIETAEDISTIIQQEGWNHVVFTLDPENTNTGQMYFNGELVNTSEMNNSTFNNNSRPLSIGGYTPGDSYRNSTGMIDEVRIYDRVLTSTEIDELSSQEANYPVPSGPVAYFPFDGQHNDLAQNTHPTAHGEIAYTKGIKDQALELDGNSENYISAVPLPSVGDAFNFSSDKISISAWAYITGGHVAPRIVELADSSGDICRLWHQGDSIHFGLVSTGDVLSYEVEGLEWVHMVGVYDETAQKMKLYIDGKKVKEQTVDSFIPDVTKIFIGNAYDGTRSFNGYIDEVYIYNRVLSQSEISKLANLCPFHYEFVSETGNALVSSTQCSFDDINRWQFKKSMKSLIIDGSIDISLELIKSLAEKYNTYLLPTSIITTLSTWKNEVYNPVMIVPVGEFDVYRPLIENSDYSVYICPTDDTTAIVLLDFMKNSDYFDQINYQWISLELAWGSTVIGTTGEEDLLTADEIKNLDKTKNYIVFPDVYADTSIDSDHPKVVEMRGFLWRDTPTGDNFYRSTVTITDNNSMCEDEVLMSIPTIY